MDRNNGGLSVTCEIVCRVSNETIPVRLVEWNVAMSLQSKTQLLAALHSTFAALPESAHPDRTGPALEAIGATSLEWIGSNPNKGLLVVAFGGWTLRLDDSYDPGYQWVMPLHLTGPRYIRVLAVWDMNHRGKGHERARQLGACRASQDHYESFLTGDSDLTLISGDFNNSVHWDKPSKGICFGDFMDQIYAQGFVSAYHSHHGCARGAEQHPTLWWMKNIETSFHIDYTFVSNPEAIMDVRMGTNADWIAHSDHSPMTVDLRVGRTTSSETSPSPPPVNVKPTEPNERVAIPTATKVEKAAASQIPRGIAAMHFPIEPGALPDMPCGVNGKPFVKSLRPNHFTAEWKDGALKEVRIWGPQVLKDGTVGVRMLDHVWHDVKGSGPVRLSHLPPFVANQLRTHARANGLPLPAE